MEIGDSISSAYGMNSLFGQSGRRNRQQPLDLGTSVPQSGASVQPSTLQPSTTPGELIRAQILDKLDLTEDALKGMDQHQGAAVEKQIADEIKKQLTGVDDKDTDKDTGQQAGIVTA
jgi:hypothetical protein